MPVTTWQAIVGKFLASWAFLALALALTFPVVLTVNYMGDPDNGIIFSGYVGSVMLAGVLVSALIRHAKRNLVLPDRRALTGRVASRHRAQRQAGRQSPIAR